jgi:pyruvate formate lyase activating enzyme
MPAVSGTIFDIKQFAVHDGPGIRTTVFFKGCPLDCAWCHNPESRCPEPQEVSALRRAGGRQERRSKTIGCTVSAESAMKEIRRDAIFFEESGGGVTFSGGEPLMQPEFLEFLLVTSRAEGFHTAVDTCGYAPSDVLERIAGLTDLFLYDLKVMDSSLHEQYTGVTNDIIHDNLRRLIYGGVSVVIRIPMIPGVTDTDQNIEQAADFLQSLSHVRRIDLLPYNRLGEDKIGRYGLSRQITTAGEQSSERLQQVRNRLRSRGFDVQIGG